MNIELNDNIINSLYKSHWVLNHDLEKYKDEELNEKFIQLNDNYFAINLDEGEELITSFVKNIANKTPLLANHNLSAVIYNFLENTSINQYLIYDYELLNSEINRILFFLIKCKFIYQRYKISSSSFDFKNDKNMINILSNIIDIGSSELILENLFRYFGNIEEKDEFKLLSNIDTDELNMSSTSSISLNNYNMYQKSSQKSRQYLYNLISYKYINQSKLNITNNLLISYKIFNKLLENKKNNINFHNIKITEIFPFCKKNNLIDLQSNLNNLFNFDNLLDNIKTFKIERNFLNQKLYENEYLFNQFYKNNIDLKTFTNLSDKNNYLNSINDITDDTILITKNTIINSNDTFKKTMKLYYNIITGDILNKILMNENTYKYNRIIILEEFILIINKLFINIKKKIDLFIKEIRNIINNSNLDNKDLIINSLYDLKRIYTLKSILKEDLKFILVSDEDFKKVICNSNNLELKKDKKNLRINNFFRKCMNDNGFYNNLIDFVKNLSLFKKISLNKTKIYYKIDDKFEINDKSSDTLNFIDLYKLKHSKYININDTLLKDKFIEYYKIIYNPLGLVNILNNIINKNKQHHNSIKLYPENHIINSNLKQIINKYIKNNHLKQSIECKKIILRLLHYFENGIHISQYNNLLYIVKNTNDKNIKDIYLNLYKNIVKNLKSYYLDNPKKTYKTYYYYLILNCSNQIKTLFHLLKLHNKKKLIEIINKMRIKYTKKLQSLFKNKINIPIKFSIATNPLKNLSKFKKNNSVINKKNNENSKSCSIFKKKISILSQKDINDAYKLLIKQFDDSKDIDSNINIIENIFDTLFLNIKDFEIYIPIVVFNLGSYIIPQKFKYLNLKCFYTYLKDVSNYKEEKLQLFLKKMLIGFNKFDDKIFVDEIDDSETDNIFIITCLENIERNNPKFWRNLNFYKFMYNHIYTNNYSNNKNKLYALSNLLKYLFNLKFYKKYNTKIITSSTTKELKKIYKSESIKSNKKTIFDSNIVSYQCFTTYISNIIF